MGETKFSAGTGRALICAPTINMPGGSCRSRAALKLFSQPTIQPTECDVLYDLRVVWQSPRVL
jgi:hypothetical protein